MLSTSIHITHAHTFTSIEVSSCTNKCTAHVHIHIHGTLKPRALCPAAPSDASRRVEWDRERVAMQTRLTEAQQQVTDHQTALLQLTHTVEDKVRSLVRSWKEGLWLSHSSFRGHLACPPSICFVCVVLAATNGGSGKTTEGEQQGREGRAIGKDPRCRRSFSHPHWLAANRPTARGSHAHV